jgi:hypothetical protein
MKKGENREKGDIVISLYSDACNTQYGNRTISTDSPDTIDRNSSGDIMPKATVKDSLTVQTEGTGLSSCFLFLP